MLGLHIEADIGLISGRGRCVKTAYRDFFTGLISAGIYRHPSPKCRECIYCGKLVGCHILGTLVHLLKDWQLMQIGGLDGDELECDEKEEAGPDGRAL